MAEKIARKISRRVAQLQSAATSFEPGQFYTEPEVNEILVELFDDHVFARRLLISWDLLDRTPDGSRYWLATKYSE
jgi:hypothetical protein